MRLLFVFVFLLGLVSCGEDKKSSSSNSDTTKESKEKKKPTFKGAHQTYEIIGGIFNQDSCLFSVDGWVLKSDPSKIVSGTLYSLNQKTGVKWLEKSIEPGHKEYSKGSDGFQRYHHKNGKIKNESIRSQNGKKTVHSTWTEEGIKKYETIENIQDTVKKQIFSWFNAGDPSKTDGSLRSQEFSTILKSGTFKDSLYVYSDNYISAKKYFKNGLLQGYSYWYNSDEKEIGRALFNEGKFVKGKGTYSYSF